jgi:integrase
VWPVSILPRMIADQLGHSRVSMTQDVYLGRRSRWSRIVAALGASIRWCQAKVSGSVGPGTGAMA